MLEQRFDTLRDDDDVKEIVLDSGMKIALHVARARSAPGGWRLASAKSEDMMETFERFFASLIEPPKDVTVDDVFKQLSINDVQMIVQLVVPFLAPQPASIRSRR